MVLSVGILGATGYTGAELIRLLITHPEVELTVLTSERFAGQKISEVFPALRGRCDLPLTKIQTKEIGRQTTLVFCCLPHQTAMLHVPAILEKGSKVIDLSADFRLDSATVYRQWYAAHTAPELLKTKVYGLTEWYREAIKEAFLVANPGCYPTAVLLGIAPLIKKQLIVLQPIICDAKSGVSGAGRTPVQETLFSELNEGVAPYKIDGHRHTPEIEQELSKLAGESLMIRFTPHLIPMDRGIVATTYVKPLKRISSEELYALYARYYEREPFVRVLPFDQLPNTKNVRGTNYCDLAVRYDPRTELITVISAIDNLTKGASGQAIQNMNVMSGLDETTGLLGTALVP